MTISLHNCWTCHASLLGLDLPDESMFWCSPSCENSYEAKVRESMTAREEETPEAEMAPLRSESPSKPSTALSSKGSIRKQKTCGRCGQKGHNARTCKGRAKVSAEKVAKVAAAPKGATRVSGRGDPGKQKTCGRCGQKGHNARTCGKR